MARQPRSAAARSSVLAHHGFEKLSLLLAALCSRVPQAHLCMMSTLLLCAARGCLDIERLGRMPDYGHFCCLDTNVLPSESPAAPMFLQPWSWCRNFPTDLTLLQLDFFEVASPPSIPTSCVMLYKNYM